MEEITLLNLKRQYEGIKEEIQDAITRVLDSSSYIMGEEVKKFEREMAEYCSVKYAIGVASGTDALLLALKALDIKPDDQVIVPTFTFFATAGVVSRLGAIPVFVDIDPVTYNINPAEIEKKITAQTKAIIPVHLYGQPAEMDQVNELANQYNLPVVEDACQAIGAEYKGIKVGNFGQAAAFSFFPAKNLGAYGDAGMVLTNDDKLGYFVKKLRIHGSEPKYYHSIIGYNSRLDTIQAAILRVKLKYLDEWTKGRQRIAETYDHLFKEYTLDDRIILPKRKNKNITHVYHQYVIRVQNRDRVQAFLKNMGISTAVYYPLPLHLQACYDGLGYKEGEFPIAEKACQEVLALPIDPDMNMAQIKYVINNCLRGITNET